MSSDDTAVDAYPLTWPAQAGPRTPSGQRRRARFGHKSQDRSLVELTIDQARRRLCEELERFGVEVGYSATLSTNLQVRLDGMPRSSQKEPADPGVAVYFRYHGEAVALACDEYDRVADNLAALAAVVRALREIERHGSPRLLRQAFTGFTAIPEHAGAGHMPAWWDVLGVKPRASREDIETAFRALALRCHPDRADGDAPHPWHVLQAAYEQGKAATA